MTGTTSVLGGGNHVVTVYGHDTISICGPGTDLIDATGGQAAVFGPGGAFGPSGMADISGGVLGYESSSTSVDMFAVNGSATLFGGSLPTEMLGGSGFTTMMGGVGPDTFIGGTGSSYMQGGFGPDTFIGGGGNETMVGGFGPDIFAAEQGQPSGSYLIANFVSGQDQLYLEGNSLSALQSAGDIHASGGNTIIQLDGGKTTITLQGVGSLSSSDVTTHKPS